MIKKLIQKISKNNAEKITEEVYIDRIASFEKECWRRSLKEDAIFIETRKYINRLNLSQEMHPFLVKFRDDLNNAYKNSRYNTNQYHKLFRSFHEYRTELKLTKKENESEQ